MKLRLAPLAATVLLATACSGSPDDTASEAGTAPATSTPATSTPATSAPASSVPSSTTTATTTTEAPAARAVDVVPRPEASTVADLLALARPLVIAHAGGDFEAPHSTMYAFTLAALAGTDVLEMDVMTTADDVLVVHHDDTVDRTTETTGAVRDLTYDELVELDNAHWFVEGTWSDQSRPDDEYLLRGVRTGARPAPEGFGPDDFRIETFRSVAESFPNHVLDVEIKVQSTPEGEPDLERAVRTARLLADEIADLGRGESVIVVSFDVDVIAAFRDAAPGVATSPALDTLVGWYVGEPVEFAASDVVFQVPPVFGGIEVLTPDVVARAQADGFEVWAWMDDTSTQENADFYADLIGRGIDGLLVSRPVVALDVVAD